MLLMTMGARIRAEREGRGWSQEELASRVGVSRGRISQMETEAGAKTDAVTLLRLAKAFEVNPYWLIGEKAERAGMTPGGDAPQYSELTRIAAQRLETLEETAKMHFLRMIEYVQTISNPKYWEWSEKERQAAHKRASRSVKRGAA